MKKLISVILCLCLAAGALSVGALAADDEYSDYPLIVVPGYSATSLYRIDENGEQVHVWGVEMQEILEAVLQNIAQIGIGLGKLAYGDPAYLAQKVGEEFSRLYFDMACNPDGTSKYDLERYCVTAEQCCKATLDELYEDDKFQYETNIADQLSELIGSENIFYFNGDFRLGSVYCAAQLDEFISSVKQYTGKDKVNIFSVSYGGLETAVYLNLYGEKGDVNNAVMTVPAIGGAGLAYDILNSSIEFDELGLMYFVEHGCMDENNYNWLMQAQALGFLDDVLNELTKYIFEILGYWQSIWDFVPTKYYEQLKQKLLDSEESAALIEKSDYFHYELLPDMAQGFKRAQQAGADIFIIAGYGNRVVTGLNESSDAIITIEASTGATVAPLGQRFADGYVQKVDTGFYQVSPCMTVDASTSYMPEHTWFVEDLYHGMTFKDSFTKQLVTTLLLTEDIKDIHSDPAYPQFHATTNRAHGIFAAFNSSTEGYLSSADTALVVKNISDEYDTKIMSVSVRGTDLSFSSIATPVLKPGESVEIPIKGEIEQVSGKNIDIVIDFVQLGSITGLGERCFNFTIQNGEQLSYDSENPFVQADLDSGYDTVFTDEFNDMFDKIGISPLLRFIYNILEPLFNLVRKIVKMFT